jgi:YVTN family beta-propeller protein
MLRLSLLTTFISAITALAVTSSDEKGQVPGPTPGGFLLPNGWHLTPAGRQVPISDLPLNIYALKDNRHALVASNGFNRHELYLVDLREGKVLGSEWARQSWFGLAVSKTEDRVWWSGGGNGFIHTFDLKDGAFTRLSKKEVNPADLSPLDVLKLADEFEKKKTFIAGMCLDESKGVLYSLDINAGTITARDIAGKAKPRTGVLGGRPYDLTPGTRGDLLYVSDWSHRQVLVVDAAELRIVARIPVGEHPNQIATHPRDGRLFVACASSDAVHVIEPNRGIVTEVIATGLFPRAPEGSTPDAAAVSPDGKTLYVANADNNCIAVVDVEKPNESIVKGFIPTGWYPTAVAVTPDSKTILVGVGKGNQTRPNPLNTRDELAKKEKDEVKQIAKRLLPYPYIGTTLSGALSIVPAPDEKQLKDYTAQVFKNCPYSSSQLTAAPHPVETAIPTRVGDPSPIKYVIYVIKENRTYDQVFGDLAAGPKPRGNGDPTLCMFPRKVTPNHHKLVEEFVLLDNLYCNGQVSRDGHPWSTGAYNTDYIARDWHLTYSARKGVDDDEEGNLSNPPSGYLWDACKRAGVSYRSYGEYGKRVSDGMGGLKMDSRVPGLVGHMCPDFGIPKKKGAKVRDTENVETFLKEYNQFARDGSMPRFIVMSLGEDHTEGTKIGGFSPQACVASNDLALGRLVEAVSRRPLWKETAIFVIEDDAQNGPDHVDAHRSVGLVISPYTKRKHVDSTLYQTVSMIRTMELILGLPPLSQYDAAARPMFGSFTDKADLTPFEHEQARIDLETRNDKLSFGAALSEKMDFSDYDRVNDFELNYVLWHAVMGKDAPQPPAVRRAIAFRAMRDQ